MAGLTSISKLSEDVKKSDEIINLTLNSLLTNPTGKNTSYMASRARIINGLEVKYSMLLRKHKKFDTKCFKKDKNFYFYIKIPSETVKNLFYDVFLEFVPTEDAEKDMTLNRYNIHLFSNSPDFMFTYDYVINKNGLLIEMIRNKYAKQAITEEPKVKNPIEIYGFEKSCYYACMYIKDKNLNKKFLIHSGLFELTTETLEKNIKTQEEKLKEYNDKKKMMVSQSKINKAIKSTIKNTLIKTKNTRSKTKNIKKKK